MEKEQLKAGSGEAEPRKDYSDNYTKSANAANVDDRPEELKAKRFGYPYTMGEAGILWMPFEIAFDSLRRGLRIKRADWKGYWVYLNDISLTSFNGQGEGAITKVKQGIIIAHKADGTYVPAAPTQDDMLAVDWEVIG